MSACRRQDYAMAQLLLDHCEQPIAAMISAYNRPNYDRIDMSDLQHGPLSIASELQDVRMIDLLLSKCTVPPDDALILAVSSGSYECVACALQNRCDSLINRELDYYDMTRSPLQLCSQLGLVSIVELLEKHGAVPASSSYVLDLACIHGHVNVAAHWVAKGMKIDADAELLTLVGISSVAEVGAEIIGI